MEQAVKHYTTDIYDRTVKQRALLERAVKIIDYELAGTVLMMFFLTRAVDGGRFFF